MKLNLGCGVNHQPGWLNVDSAPACKPDTVWDLEKTPWPWPDSSVEEMLFNHSLEHMGQDAKTFLAIVLEIYRVARPGAVVRINVPHPRHDDFLNDPTHVRAITPEMLMMFDRARNEELASQGAANTPFALYLGVDFEVFDVFAGLDEPYASQVRKGQLRPDQVAALVRERNNVIREYQIKIRVRKAPPR